jgi:DNA primase
MDAVDEVKQRLSIEDVISEYVPLAVGGENKLTMMLTLATLL